MRTARLAFPFLATALLAVSVQLSLPVQASETSPLDISGVTRVNLVGDASQVRFTTAERLPYTATVTHWPSGWLSHWYALWLGEECRTAIEMTVLGTTLTIRVSPALLGALLDCHISVDANLPAGGDISIDQAATKASLSGTFGAIHLASQAADVDFNGHANSIVTKGDAMRVKINFTSIRHDETISLTSKALDADLSFGGAPISYRVDATASMIDSTLDNTPGAMPAVLIKADFARARIR